MLGIHFADDATDNFAFAIATQHEVTIFAARADEGLNFHAAGAESRGGEGGGRVGAGSRETT